MDPCAGAYPAFYHGNPAVQIPMVMQITDPAASVGDADKTKAFNEGAQRVIDDFYADVDDKVDNLAGSAEVFGDGMQSNIHTAVGGLAAFSSDYANFEAIGVPIMNLFPDMFGPHADNSPASAEGVATIHTPRDHLQTINQFTSGDQTGATASDGWMTGMELCANLEGRYMLQPEMAGAQTSNLDPVAFMELTKPVAQQGKFVTFDAAGSYQYASLVNKSYVADGDLQYKWDFGDGSPAAFGKTVKHAYKKSSDVAYKATLTVTNRDTHQSDAVTRLVLVGEGEGTDVDPDQSGDPGLRAKNSVVACQSAAQFKALTVKPEGKGLAFFADTANANDTVEVQVFQNAKGRRAVKRKRVAKFSFKGQYKWDGKGAKAKGTYSVLVSTLGTAARPDVRGFAFTKAAKFKARKPFQRTDTCQLLSLFRLGAPSFGGKQKLLVNFTTTKDAKITVKVLRGSKKVKTLKAKTSANRLNRVTLKPKKLRKGEYKVVLTAVSGSEKQSGTLYARKY
jgi:PKD repeat protein